MANAFLRHDRESKINLKFSRENGHLQRVLLSARLGGTGETGSLEGCFICLLGLGKPTSVDSIVDVTARRVSFSLCCLVALTVFLLGAVIDTD